MTKIRNLTDASEYLSATLADLTENIEVAQATWAALGDPTTYGYMADADAIDAWEQDLKACAEQESIVVDTFHDAVKQMAGLNTQWVSFLTSL